MLGLACVSLSPFLSLLSLLSFLTLPPPPTTGRGAVCMTIKVDHGDVLIAGVTGSCVPHVPRVYYCREGESPGTRGGVKGCQGDGVPG